MNSQHEPLLIDLDSVRRSAAAAGFDLPPLIWDESCGSTNDELAELVRAGVGPTSVPTEFTIRGTDHQHAGHGRLGRTWTVPPRRSLTFSILLTPPTGFEDWGWIPLIAGEAVRAAIAEAGVPAVLKWPNDVLTEAGDKLCGILARVETTEAGAVVILGIGINTLLAPADLPRADASSLAIELGSEDVDHAELLVSVLRRLIPAYRELVSHMDRSHDGRSDGGSSHNRGDFAASEAGRGLRENMVTLGSVVRIERPDGTRFTGRATGLAADGSLRIAAEGSSEEITVNAGDVHHVRMADD